MSDILAALPPLGGTISLAKLVVVLVFAIPWLFLAPRVQRDVKFIRAPKMIWEGLVLGAGAVGLLLWLILPSFAVGLLAYVVLTGGALLAYGFYRDGRVEDSDKILSIKAMMASLATKSQARKIEIVEKVKLYDSTGRVVRPPADVGSDPQGAQTYNITQDLLYDMVYRRASVADFSPQATEMRVRYVIDGVVVDRPAMPLSEGQRAVEYLKPVAGLDVEEQRRPQEGELSVDIGGDRVDMYLKTAGTTGGQMMQFRVVQQVVQTDIATLGFRKKALETLRKHANADHGILLLSGRAGSGVTSTQYALLRDLDAYIKQLVTLEAKPPIQLENVTQNKYESPDELPSALAAALRRDPDVIMLDRCPDEKTAEMVLEAGRQKLLLVGLVASDSFVALAKWIKLCPSAEQAVANLRLVVCQMLIRKLCEACRESYRPDQQLLTKANLKVSASATFNRPPKTAPRDEKGNLIICPACQNTRYVGRTGVYEMLEMNDDVRQLVASNASLQDIKGACRRARMLYMQEEALQKVVQGVTGIQEVIRATQKKK